MTRQGKCVCRAITLVVSLCAGFDLFNSLLVLVVAEFGDLHVQQLQWPCPSQMSAIVASTTVQGMPASFQRYAGLLDFQDFFADPDDSVL